MQQPRQHAALTLTVARVAHLAREYDLDAFLIKGAALVALGDNDRVAGDVDIVVPAAQTDAWVEMLLGEGWKPDHDPPDVMLRWWGAAQLFPAPGNAGIGVDVHSRIESAPNHAVIDFEALCAGQIESPWPGLRVPDRAGLLLVAAVHWIRHDPSTRLPRWLSDAGLIATPEAVATARDRAGGIGCVAELENYLFEAGEHLGVDFGAEPVPLHPAVAAVHRFGKGKIPREVAWIAALGPVDGARYVFDRVGPARFRREGGISGVSAWLRRRIWSDPRRND